MKIRVLDKKLANMIAAGEVVEKPASVVKELVENSIDAGATRIVIEIEDGGIQRIEITDNGCGMAKEDAPLAFKAHATSKIKAVDDLGAIATLGFRGEALASIAAVSEVELTTKTENDITATKLKISGGDILETTETAAQTGTKIVVKNIFFNTPARKKFLNKPKVEEKDITKIVERFMIGCPHIKFQYKVNGMLIYNTLGTGLFDNIYLIYGKDVADGLIEIDFTSGKYTLQGYTSVPSLTKPNRTFQVSFLNGRMVKDMYMENAIQFAYQDYLMHGNFPVCFLNLKVPFDTVDVNIHPSKQEVKYENVREINSFFINALKDALEKNHSKKFNEIFKDLSQKGKSFDALENFKNKMETVGKGYGISYQRADDVVLKASPQCLQEVHLEEEDGETYMHTTPVQYDFKPKVFSPFPAARPVEPPKQQQLEFDLPKKRWNIVGVAFKTYIILEVDDKILLIDQHACHERKIYDKLLQEIESENLLSQSLLSPYTFECSTDEAKFFTQHLDDFASIGISLEEFGENLFRVRAVPFLIRDIEYDEFFEAIKANQNRFNFSKKELLKDFLAQTACKAAVKAGDKLSDEDIDALLNDIDNHKVLTCPHGRPFVHTISKKDLEKLFKRIV